MMARHSPFDHSAMNGRHQLPSDWAVSTQHFPIWLLVAVVCVACLGCSESAPPVSNAPAPTSAPAAPMPVAQPAEPAALQPPAEPPPQAAKSLVRTDESGRKWVGDIPYDVWFDDPLAVVADDTEVTTAPAAAEVPESPETTEATETPDATPAVEGSKPARDWAAILPPDIVTAEVKNIRNRLSDSLQSVGRYNGNYKEIQIEGATLAALGSIVSKHAPDVSWAPRAAYVRDLGAQLEQNAQKLGREAYQSTRRPFEQVETVLDGSVPTDVKEPEPAIDVSERADRSGLMKRIDNAFQWLRKEATSAASLKSNRDRAVHEASILTALTIVAAEGQYASADEEKYQQHATEMTDAGSTAIQAIRDQEYETFANSLNLIEKKCNDCHQEYRFGE